MGRVGRPRSFEDLGETIAYIEHLIDDTLRERWEDDPTGWEEANDRISRAKRLVKAAKKSGRATVRNYDQRYSETFAKYERRTLTLRKDIEYLLSEISVFEDAVRAMQVTLEMMVLHLELALATKVNAKLRKEIGTNGKPEDQEHPRAQRTAPRSFLRPQGREGRPENCGRNE